MPQDQSEAVPIVLNALRGVHFYNGNPRLLALPVAPDINRRFRMENDGFGLALRLDDILGYDRSRFARLEDRFRRMFNNIRSVKLIPEQAYSAPVNRVEQITMLSRSAGKGLYFEIDGGTLVSAAQISDGILLVLAYLAVLNLPGPPRMLLIEEPERGVHPKRLQEVVEIVRELVPEQTPTQVVFSTHSPYVVDLFEPKEVSLCRRLEDGSIAVARLSDRPTVREQLKVFTLGEIWTGEGDEAIAKSASASGAATR
jgi:predicted ATPase